MTQTFPSPENNSSGRPRDARRPEITVLALLVVTMLAGPIQAATIFDYRFEGGPLGGAISTLVDSGPLGLNGTVSSLTFDAGAPGGGNFSANASGDFNYASVTDNAAMHLQEFTLSALVKRIAAKLA